MFGFRRQEFSSDPAPAESFFERMVTIAIFRDPIYAYISKTILDSDGIESFVSNNCTDGSVNLFTRIETSYKLRVRESDMARAVETLLQEPEEDQ